MTRGYRRILLKLSGEALQGANAGGISPSVIERFAVEIADLAAGGVEIGLVVGGGNIFRGSELVAEGLDRVTGDQMGMLATAINALALKATLERLGRPATVLTAFPVGNLAEPFSRDRAVAYLESGRVVIFAAGTGNPFFTTDTAASLRAIEIGAEILIKATRVDGVYAADPERVPDAERYDALAYDEVIQRGLAVMDTTAVVLCRDHRLPLRVMNINRPGALARVVAGEAVGTLVHAAG